MGRSRSRWTPPRPGLAMERHIADICACLEGDVDLMSRDESEANHDLPVPSIIVIFRAETVENANHNANHNQPQHPKIPSNLNAHNNNNTNSNTTNDGSIARYDAIMRQVHDKLVAIRTLSFIARCPEYSWHGNPRFWWHVLNNICDSSHCEVFLSKPLSSSFRHREEPPSCAPATNVDEVPAMPKFELMFPRIKINNALLELCAQAFSSTPNETFQRVDQRARDVLTKLGVRIPQQSRRMVIDLNFSRSRLRMIHCMEGVKKLLQAASVRCKTTHLPKLVFATRCLDLSDTIVSERDLGPLAQMTALPTVGVSELKLNWVFTANMSQRFMRSFCEFMAVCFAISLSKPPVTTSLTKLYLDSSTLSAFQLASLFSAVHGSNSWIGVRELSLRGLEGKDSWLWLAFGIFHPNSTSPIVHLDLSYCVLQIEDVELVCNLMDSADYSPFLMQRTKSDRSCSSSQSQWVLIPASTRLEIPRDKKKHFGSGRPAPALKLETELWCEALDSGISWTCVLIPAYGKVYVKNSHIVKTETRGRNKHSCKLKSLTMIGVQTQILRVGHDGELLRNLGTHPIHQVLSEWIKTVGYSLETLHLRNNPLGTRALVTILASCPMLTDLDVSGCELTDIGPIASAFRGENCVLRKLKAAQNHIGAGSQVDFFELLGDVGCDSIHNLQVLHLEDNPTSRENRILTVLLRSFRRNRTLRHLVLTMDGKHVQYAQNLRYRFDRDHHGQWLGHENLPFQHRLAVLSIAMFKTLPTAVIEIIFDFARRDVYRQVIWE